MSDLIIPKRDRIEKDDAFLKVADTISLMATCDRGYSGCVIVRDNRILTTGYVGSPPGMAHCDDVGHEFVTVTDANNHSSEHCVRTIHAEQNAILQAAIVGISIKGADLYCRMTPCRTCAMFIIACGIKKVVCEKIYRAGAWTEKHFKEAGIELVYKHNEVQKYPGEK